MVAQDGTAPGQSGSKDAGKLWGEILSANGSVVVWLIFLTFGGAFLSLYYSRIQYFPDLQWNDSLTYLAALSLLGGGVAVIYGLLLFIPGAMWSEFLIHDEDLKDKLCFDESHSEPCFWSVGLFMGLPYLIFMLVMHFAALPGDPWLTTMAAAILLGVISWFLWCLFKEYLDRKEARDCWCVIEEQEKKSETNLEPTIWQRILDFSEGRSKKTRLLRYVIAFDVSALASLFSTILLFSLVDSENKLGPKSLLIYICTGLVTLSNFLVAVQFRHRPFRALMTALLATLVLLVCSEVVDGRKAALSTGIMKKFGIGVEAPLVTLVADAEAQMMFKQLQLYPPPGQAQETVPDVLILSRLGNEYLLEMKRYQVKEEGVLKNKKLEITRVRVVVPRKHVLSWSVQTPTPRSPTQL